MAFETHLSHDLPEANDHQTRAKGSERGRKQNTGTSDYGPSWSGGEYSGRNPFAASESTTQSSGRGEELLKHDENPSMWHGEGESSGSGWTDRAEKMTDRLQKWDILYYEAYCIQEHFKQLSNYKQFWHKRSFDDYTNYVNKYVSDYNAYHDDTQWKKTKCDIIEIVNAFERKNNELKQKLGFELKSLSLDQCKEIFNNEIENNTQPGYMKKAKCRRLCANAEAYLNRADSSTRIRNEFLTLIRQVMVYGKQHGFDLPALDY